MDKPPVGDVSEPLKYKTWFLKVSIHCEGCKKKVKRVLQSIDGVYQVDIDSKQHKVTVTGNVEGEWLVRKLIKAGKQAELWPEEGKKSKKKKNQKDSPKAKEGSESDAEDKEKGAQEEKGKDEDKKGNPDKEADHDSQDEEESGAPPPNGDAVGGGGGGGGGNGGKKKKKKKKKKNPGGVNGDGGGNVGGGGPSSEPAPPNGNMQHPVADQINLHRPLNDMYAYPQPPQFHPYPAPEYGLSYNAAPPSAISSSYYTMPVHTYSTYSHPYAYSHPYDYLPLSDPIMHGYGHSEQYYDNNADDEGGCSIM